MKFPVDFESKEAVGIPPYDLSSVDNRTIPAAMVFSSGTSGKPKGVVLSHHNLIAHLLTVRTTNPFVYNAQVREVFYPSFAHIYGVTSGILVPAWTGGYVVAMKHYDFLPYLQRCSEIKGTILRLVPATAIRLVKDPASRGLDLTTVKTVMCAGAALPPEIVTGLQSILDPGTTVLNGYGMSEATIALQRDTRSAKAGSVGKPASGVSIRVVDDNGGDVRPGEDGECLVQTPTVFMHYKDNPSETKATFDGRWLKTGDVVRVDDDGFFWLTGRKKELIKYKANQVAPAELEAILLEHPLVSEAGVCGMYDESMDTEVPAGCVVLAQEANRRQQQEHLKTLKSYLDNRVAPYKKLRGGIYAVKSLPKGSTGKLLRRELPSLIGDAKRQRSCL
ncbi:hypothetical protein JX266_010198 [Neoarthrinium moseri]|uniref:uncharacterized protein n=1 Tax=Neoarthrinium moseri TaxID=1658444 RepID=UPI001FDDC252|nr:uncharacterized protein JN550_009073 [Neoarthrinium moseri]KAI1843565.1 hypothetical protein JX266_010198 [Neoarthrinium moseri]KAI1864053.1 hypothetical protein JN550_009073 [Neoarthrinium moseri]